MFHIWVIPRATCHCNQVAEPLVSELMGYHVDDTVLVLLVACVLVVQYGGRAVGDKAPILHGTV